jgi:hypothetical protein
VFFFWVHAADYHQKTDTPDKEYAQLKAFLLAWD